MKKFWSSYWYVLKTSFKWVFGIYGALAYLSLFFDLGWNGGDIEQFGNDILRRFLPKCIYERCGYEEEEA